MTRLTKSWPSSGPNTPNSGGGKFLVTKKLPNQEVKMAIWKIFSFWGTKCAMTVSDFDLGQFLFSGENVPPGHPFFKSTQQFYFLVCLLLYTNT